MPDNTIEWGQGAVNNNIDWGKGASNNSNDWGVICSDSPSGDTNLIGGGSQPAFSNTKSLLLDGVDDGASTNHSGWGASFTWSAWIKLTSSSGYNAVYCDDSNVVPYFTTSNNGSGTNIIYGHTFGELTSNTTINTGSWNHVLIRKSSGALNLFINGQLDSTTGTDIGSYSSGTARIGNFPSFVGMGGFHGKIDELALFNSALSNSNIASIYNGGTPTDVSSLNPVNYWRFENNGTDLGSGSNTATLVNGATFSTDVP